MIMRKYHIMYVNDPNKKVNVPPCLLEQRSVLCPPPDIVSRNDVPFLYSNALHPYVIPSTQDAAKLV